MASLIDGVKIKKLVTHTDDRGYFREILRDDDKFLERFGQSAISVTMPGIIKAFHWHKNQDDVWYVISGNAKVALYDRRENSPTFKKSVSLIMGGNTEAQILFIPRGVAHGYQVLSSKPLVMLYFMNKSYDKDDPDEQRIPYDDPEIGFNWEAAHK